MRYASVDILRGLTVAVMILVNNPGSWSHVHPWLLHAPWYGCTLADLVFPFFLFIVGLSIVFALSKALKSGADKSLLALKALKRGLILIGLGLFLNAFPDFDWSTLRYPGVLQRIGLVFLLGALAFIYLSEKQRRWLTASILIGYWVLLCFVPVPDTGVVSLEKNQNWASWIDQQLLSGHMWRFSQTWDPEGVLSTFPALATVLLGISAALYLQRSVFPEAGLAWTGGLLAMLGWGWSWFFPMNKALWTSSFALFTAGLALLLLAFAVYCFDRKHIQTGTMPFRALGANPLAAYFGAEMLARVLILVKIQNIPFISFVFDQLATFIPPVTASFVMALVQVMFWTILTVFLYKRKIFIKI